MTDPQRLGRETDWREADDGPVRGIGQRLFMVGEEALGIMDSATSLHRFAQCARMSGRGGPRRARRARVQAPLLDRLIDDAPDRNAIPPLSAAETMALLRNRCAAISRRC